MSKQAQLGNHGPTIAQMGYGAMVLEGFYGESDDTAAISTLRHAMERGMMIDTADAYGSGHNEALVAQALAEHGGDAFIATKFGIVFDEAEDAIEVPSGWGYSININARPDYASRALDASLKRLGVETVDLWYAHYPDPVVPIAETVAAMAKAVSAGKVKHLGLSNVTADQVRAAHAVHPIAAVQYEYSLWRREAEKELLPTLRELDIALVGWSPLGGGFLTGSIETLAEGDFRNNNPRFQGDNLQHNLDRFAPLKAIAADLNISPAQLALAWLTHQGPDVIPIPGTRNPARIDENLLALDIALDAAQLEKINRIAAPGSALGGTLL
ncbi:MAG: aldo/keto reductase [Pseudomonadota bacterium]